MGEAEPTDDSPAAGVECAYCGAPVETQEWHPVTSDAGEGEFRIVAFCGHDCREQWLQEPSHPGQEDE